MLLLDRSKGPILARNTGSPFAMLRAYRSARPGMDGLHGLGLNTNTLYEANQFNPEPITRTAIQVMQAIEQFFGVGQGRREANQIVPIQNEIHYNVLAPIAEAVNASYASGLSQSQLQQMLDALLGTKDYWLHFLHDTEWSDGRAAVQAEETLAFLFEDQERKIRQLLPNAPYWNTVEPPEVIPVGGGTTTGPGTRPGTGYQTGGLNILRTSSSILPWILAGAFIFMLPKIGKR